MGSNPTSWSCNRQGSRVFDDAWNDYIDSLRGYFSNVAEGEDQEQTEFDEEDCPTLKVSRKEYERWCAPWRKSLIIKLLGKSIPLWLMKENLARLWETDKSYTTKDLDNGFFVVSFEDEKDMNLIHEEGPWMITDRYLIVQHWQPNFDPWSGDTMKKIAAWLHIPLLLLKFFNTESLGKIRRLIGRTLKVDMITYTSDRGRFACICVELDLQKKLKSAINIFGTRRIIEYKGLHLICFHCGKYGHHRDVCPENTRNTEQNAGTPHESGKAKPVKDPVMVNVDLNSEPKETANIQVPQHNVSESRTPKRPNKDIAAGKFSVREPTVTTEGHGVWDLVQRSKGRKSGNNAKLGYANSKKEQFAWKMEKIS
ncbi:uncharacterized protein LOC114741765 [Neltuma alba]|uniref:uncharacterized protein LOC114741765 n=1 Tax=Neltuma alba TaxID=207710 RepID=UPI0010A4335E|nr:uncharacterized protein LOC114741765 [Prosopis alba]